MAKFPTISMPTFPVQVLHLQVPKERQTFCGLQKLIKTPPQQMPTQKPKEASYSWSNIIWNSRTHRSTILAPQQINSNEHPHKEPIDLLPN